MTELLIYQQHRANLIARIDPAILARLARPKVLPPPEQAMGFEPRIVRCEVKKQLGCSLPLPR
jgi:hypothetical protein